MAIGSKLNFDIFARDHASPVFDKFGKQVDRSSKSVGGLSGNTKKLLGAFAGMAVVSVAAGFLKSASKEASDLNETVSKSNIIFGKNAASMNEWSKTAATSMGLSRSQALASAAGFGDMFSQLGFGGDVSAKMSKSVVQLSADLGSFNNLETSDVTERMSAAFRGEFDSLQALIPNINAARVEKEALAMTGKKAVADLTAQEKAAATLAIVQKDGARASGDFARTAGGQANQQKILAAQTDDLKAKIGNGLLPVLTKLTAAGNSAMAWLTKNPAAVKALAAVLVVLAAAFVATQVAAFAIPLAIAAVVGGLVYAYYKFDWFKKGVDTVAKAIGTVFTWLWNNVFQPVIRHIVTGLATLMEMWGRMLIALSKVPGFEWAKKAGDKMLRAANKATELKDNIKKIPKKHETKITTPGMGGAISQARTLLNLLSGINKNKNANTSTSVPGMFQPKTNATGTNYFGGGMTWVGERGPEIVQLPSSSKVYSATKSERMMSGASGGGGRSDEDIIALMMEALSMATFYAPVNINGRTAAGIVQLANAAGKRL